MRVRRRRQGDDLPRRARAQGAGDAGVAARLAAQDRPEHRRLRPAPAGVRRPQPAGAGAVRALSGGRHRGPDRRLAEGKGSLTLERQELTTQTSNQT